MSSRSKRLGLLSQQSTMMVENGIPVFQTEATSFEELLRPLSATVNFLRCGCPAVQWIFLTQPSADNVRELLNTLVRLSLPGERLKTDMRPGEHQRGDIATFTREFESVVKSTIFGVLNANDEFFVPDDPQERRYLKVAAGPGFQKGLAVVIGETMRSEPNLFELTSPVLQILK